MNPEQSLPMPGAPMAALPDHAVPDTFASDERLRESLRRSITDPTGTGLDAARLQRLQRQALQVWAEAQPEPAPTQTVWSPDPVLAGGSMGGEASGHPASRRRGAGDPGTSLARMAASGLLVMLLIALWMWSQRPDPVLEELMRLDVLSQMAAGEM